MFHDSLNCYIELEGNWRFKGDPEWGEICRRFREGNPTLQDVNTINTHFTASEIPTGIQVATYTNKNRDAINTAVFRDYCKTHGEHSEGKVLKDAIVVFMDEMQMTNSTKTYVSVVSNKVKKWIYQNVGESDCKVSDRGRVDPSLKLYPYAPLMLTLNEDVGNGEANGTRVNAKGVRMKTGEAPFLLELECGTFINATFVSKVDCIVLEHENPDISPRVFEVEAKSFTFTAQNVRVDDVPENLKMKGFQFPIISNTCSTGHKLQGCTVKSLLVNDWCYKSNWAYVVISRVKTLAGLFLGEELTEDLSKFAKPENMKKMIK